MNSDTNPFRQSDSARGLNEERGKILNKRESLFKGLGKLRDREYHIRTYPSVKPSKVDATQNS